MRWPWQKKEPEWVFSVAPEPNPFAALVVYDEEKARGIVHGIEYAQQMEKERERRRSWERVDAERRGEVIIEHGREDGSWCTEHQYAVRVGRTGWNDRLNGYLKSRS